MREGESNRRTLVTAVILSGELILSSFLVYLVRIFMGKYASPFVLYGVLILSYVAMVFLSWKKIIELFWGED